MSLQEIQNVRVLRYCKRLFSNSPWLLGSNRKAQYVTGGGRRQEAGKKPLKSRLPTHIFPLLPQNYFYLLTSIAFLLHFIKAWRLRMPICARLGSWNVICVKQRKCPDAAALTSYQPIFLAPKLLRDSLTERRRGMELSGAKLWGKGAPYIQVRIVVDIVLKVMVSDARNLWSQKSWRSIWSL